MRMYLLNAALFAGGFMMTVGAEAASSEQAKVCLANYGPYVQKTEIGSVDASCRPLYASVDVSLPAASYMLARSELEQIVDYCRTKFGSGPTEMPTERVCRRIHFPVMPQEDIPGKGRFAVPGTSVANVN